MNHCVLLQEREELQALQQQASAAEEAARAAAERAASEATSAADTRRATTDLDAALDSREVPTAPPSKRPWITGLCTLANVLCVPLTTENHGHGGSESRHASNG